MTQDTALGRLKSVCAANAHHDILGNDLRLALDAIEKAQAVANTAFPRDYDWKALQAALTSLTGEGK